MKPDDDRRRSEQVRPLDVDRRRDTRYEHDRSFDDRRRDVRYEHDERYKAYEGDRRDHVDRPRADRRREYEDQPRDYRRRDVVTFPRSNEGDGKWCYDMVDKVDL